MSNPVSPRFGSNLMPPLLIGAAYTATRSAAEALVSGGNWGGLYWQSPVVFQFLAGLLLAMALRPVISRLPWTRGTAFALALGLLLGIGPTAQWVAAQASAGLGLLAFPQGLGRDAMPRLLALWVTAGLLAWIYRPQGGTIGWRNLVVRWRQFPAAYWWPRLVLLTTAWVGFSCAAGTVGSWFGDHPLMQVLEPENPWTQLWAAAAEPAAPGWGRWAGVTGVEALRAALAILPLLPIALAVRGSRAQLAMLFALLVFVIGAFAPLMEAQPYPSAAWLTARVGLSGLTALAMGFVMAHTVGQLPAPRPQS